MTFTRRQEIIALLKAEKSVLVSDLSTRFGVSEVTIRSDLEVLARRGLLVRTHGGALLPEDSSNSRNIKDTIRENTDLKEKLATEAAKMVSDGDTIIIDSGSTMAILARLLHGKQITVLTNSLPVMEELSKDEDIELVIIGGSFRRSVMASVGEYSSEVLKSINADILFMGCTSYDSLRGISCPNFNEKTTKRLMIEACRKVCVVTDHTKSHRTSLINVADWNEIDTFITDQMPTAEVQLLQSMNTKVVLVPFESNSVL